MSDSESIKKMLRAVLQSNKDGVSINRIQVEYRSLCGEVIPHRQLGYPTIEGYLRSIPNVVRMDTRTGEVMCFAAVCEETAHIAQLVSRQKSSKKVGRSHMVNCRLRPKPPSPFMFNEKPRSSLRQPGQWGRSSGWAGSNNQPRPRSYTSHGGFSAGGDYRKVTFTPAFTNHQAPAAAVPPAQCRGQYDPEQVQDKVAQVLVRYCSGLWLSKLPLVYHQMFHQDLPAQALRDLENWPHVCCLEKPGSNNRGDRLIYPPAPPKPSLTMTFNPSPPKVTPASPSPPTFSPITPTNPMPSLTVTFIPTPTRPAPIAPSSPRPSMKITFNPTPPTSALLAPTSPLTQPTFHFPPLQRSSGTSSPVKPGSPVSLQSPVPSPAASLALSPALRGKLKELLGKYSSGLWAHALPQLFSDTYKEPFPQDFLHNLSLLLDICTVEYPMAPNRTKAILYGSRVEVQQSTGPVQTPSSPALSGLKVLGALVPALEHPSEQYPSILSPRYIGEGYSKSQEAMEDAMKDFYRLPPTPLDPLDVASVGQLVASSVEGGDEVVRAQVQQVTTPDKVKVYYVDYGFSETTSRSKLMPLDQKFMKLPLQATSCCLAGLEGFSGHPAVLQCLETLVVGKILLMETLDCHHGQTPLVVLYDTSQDDDVNINAACLKALQDRSMDNPLTVNSTYVNMCVTNVCSDGTIYCQLPSRGVAKLNKLLDKMEAFFTTQVTSESLVSRPFCGKLCVARYRGKWCRVEITNLHGCRVMDIQFVDLGVPASVEITELREIPSVFLSDLLVIPPQAIRCCLAELPVPSPDSWTPEAVLWLRDAVLPPQTCSMRVSQLDEEQVVHIFLFRGGSSSDAQEESINRQLVNSDLWRRKPCLHDDNNNSRATADLNQDNDSSCSRTSINLSSRSCSQATLSLNGRLEDEDLSKLVEQLSIGIPVINSSPQYSPPIAPQAGAGSGDSPYSPAQGQVTLAGPKPLPMPPVLELPESGQKMDVFVSVACHPGHFVVQPWQDLYKLVVLMGEMILYYNQTDDSAAASHAVKGEVYAAMVDKNWYRVVVKGVLTNGQVSVYQLDYGKHELVRSTQLRPLIEEFRQLPFQAVTAQLAGVEQPHWSEVASILFRNHVEKRALVAQLEGVVAGSEVEGQPWERRLSLYLVDTSQDSDVWVHNIMADLTEELSSSSCSA
ncbi:tudor domain-containing protein 7A [Aplochiton taeniatus]